MGSVPSAAETKEGTEGRSSLWFSIPTYTINGTAVVSPAFVTRVSKNGERYGGDDTLNVAYMTPPPSGYAWDK